MSGLPKPYYEEPGITLYHARCEEILPYLPKADLVLTDPPYNVINRATCGLRKIDKGGADSLPVDIPTMARLIDACFAGSAYVWCSGEQYTHWFDGFRSLGSTVRHCAWWKTNPSPMNGERLWLSAVELCVFARKEKAYFSRFCEAPVWRGPIETDIPHPCPKPLWLMTTLVRASCPENGLICDPYAGSGTTLLAAKNCGCRAIGVEVNRNFCELIVERLRQSVLPLAEPEPQPQQVVMPWSEPGPTHSDEFGRLLGACDEILEQALEARK
jgi:site-specific DNA-methyltransferase (adenine-specific)